MVSLKVLGKHVRSARRRLKLNQEQVAEMSGVSLSYYGKLERGELQPALDRLALICDVLQVPLTDVLKGVSLNEDERRNIATKDAKFEEYFINLDDVISAAAKAVMVSVCRDISTLDK